MLTLNRKSLFIALGLSCCALLSTAHADTSQNKVHMFVTTEDYTGRLYGATGADERCTKESQCESGNCKAVIAVPGERQPYVAGKNQEAIKWVLFPNTTYVNNMGKTIGTTNENGVFTFPLSNAVSTSGTAWTGFYKDWTITGNDNNCDKWTTKHSNDGYYGSVKSTTNTMISSAENACGDNGAATRLLYCVMSSPIDTQV